MINGKPYILRERKKVFANRLEIFKDRPSSRCGFRILWIYDCGLSGFWESMPLKFFDGVDRILDFRFV